MHHPLNPFRRASWPTLLTACWLFVFTLSHANDKAPEEGIRLNDDQIAALGLRFARPEPVRQIEGYAWPAMVGIPLAHRDMLSAPISGRIQEILVVHGEVSKDQPLVVLESTELVEKQQRYLNTLAQLQEAEKTFARIQRLRKAGSASEKQYLAARTRLQTLQNQKKAALQALLVAGLEKEQIAAVEKSRQPISRLILKAPKDGLLFDLQVERNQRVQTRQTLSHIGQIDEVVVDVDVPIESVHDLHVGQQAQVAGSPWQGTVAFIGQQANPQTQRVTVHVRFDNPQRQLLPGAFVRVQFINEADSSIKIYRLPSRALVSGENGESIVFLRKGNSLMPQAVEARYRDDRHAIVQFGQAIDEDTQVVSLGAIFLKGMLEGDEGEAE